VTFEILVRIRSTVDAVTEKGITKKFARERVTLRT
jgi:hypothetical protein